MFRYFLESKSILLEGVSRMQEILNQVAQDQLRTDLPEFRAGDTVKVHVKVVEGSRERIQVFEGVVIRRRGGGISETFTVRKISYGVGVERTFLYILRVLLKSTLLVKVKFVVRNFITYVTFVVKQQN